MHCVISQYVIVRVVNECIRKWVEQRELRKDFPARFFSLSYLILSAFWLPTRPPRRSRSTAAAKEASKGVAAAPRPTSCPRLLTRRRLVSQDPRTVCLCVCLSVFHSRLCARDPRCRVAARSRTHDPAETTPSTVCSCCLPRRPRRRSPPRW